MDRRSVFFIVLVAATFFLVNLYFNYQDKESQAQKVNQEKVQQARHLEQLKADVGKRTAALSELPLVILYADSKGNDSLTTGIRSGSDIITLQPEMPIPDVVYVEDVDSPGDFIPLSLVVKNGGIFNLAIYGPKANRSLQLAHVVKQGSYDIQLIELGSKTIRPSIVLGEYVDGNFSIPLGTVGNDAIGLVKVEGEYLPFGIYTIGDRKFALLNDMPKVAKIAHKKETVQHKVEDVTEKFYVIENNYFQLVFSNHGGALAEVNLPFRTKTNKDSVVREVGIDRIMKEDHPYNARFPAHPYYTPGKNGGKAFVEHDEAQIGGYYPLLRRDVIEQPPLKSRDISPAHYACNIVSDYPEIANLVYKVKHFDDKSITFEAVQSYRRIIKTFSLPDDSSLAPYVVNLEVKIEGDRRGLRLSSGVPSVELMSGSSSPDIKVRTTYSGKSKTKKVDLPKDVSMVGSVKPDWICNSNGFFGLILDPLSEIGEGYNLVKVSGDAVPTRLVEVDQEYNRYTAKEFPGYEVQMPLGDKYSTMQFRVYLGPFDADILKTVDATYTDSKTGTGPDYISSQSFHGFFSFISEPFAKFLMILMRFFYDLTSSWAVSIILLTIALRVMLYPLNAWSMRSMRRMQKLSPLVSEIQQKYKKDPKKSQMEVMGLYRKYKVNPFGGCFPLLIQMPFLIGMFDLLRSSFSLRGVVFIPGWITDLTAPDVVFQWGYPIPFIGNALHVLPLLLGAVMYVQQKFSSSLPKDKSLMTDQQRQQKFMGTIMTVFFTVMFYRFPSGLNIYWLSSMLLGILQQWIVNRQVGEVALKEVSPSSGKKSIKRKK